MGGWVQAALTIFATLPLIGMSLHAGALAMGAAALSFLLGAAGVAQVRLYGVGFALMLLSAGVVVVQRAGRVSPDFVAMILLPALLVFLLARLTAQPKRALRRSRSA